jgi:acyl-coenzyme A thioesterase PaaI-like protein
VRGISGEHPIAFVLEDWMNLIVPFADYVGIRRVQQSEEGGIGLLPERKELTNHIGSQHAAAIFTAAEAASGWTVLGAFGSAIAAGVLPLVRESSIKYLKVARGEIKALGQLNEPGVAILHRLTSQGKVDFSVDVELTDASNVVVATMTVHWNLRAPRPEPESNLGAWGRRL